MDGMSDAMVAELASSGVVGIAITALWVKVARLDKDVRKALNLSQTHEVAIAVLRKEEKHA